MMVLNKDSPKPLYEQIKDYILAQIQSGAYPPHTQLPSERQLAMQLDVNRLTVSKAIRELVQAGWLYVQIGKGTYISGQPIDQQITALTSFTEEMTRRGQAVTSRVLRAEITSAPRQIADDLGLAPVVDVVVLERVRYVSNQPMAIEEAYFVAARCPDILTQHDFTHTSLYAVLGETYGIQLTHAEQTFEARAASRNEARLLEIARGAPVLAIRRIAYAQDDQPFEVVQSVYRGDRYKFRAALRRL